MPRLAFRISGAGGLGAVGLAVWPNMIPSVFPGAPHLAYVILLCVTLAAFVIPIPTAGMWSAFHGYLRMPLVGASIIVILCWIVIFLVFWGLCGKTLLKWSNPLPVPEAPSIPPIHFPSASEIAAEIKRQLTPVPGPAPAVSPQKTQRPKPPVPIKITSFEILPYVPDTVPEVRMHIKNSGDAPVRVALQDRSWTMSSIPNDFKLQRDLQERLWSQFLAELPSDKVFLSVPSGQDVWFQMRGMWPFKTSDLDKNPETFRCYFLARMFDESGKKIRDACLVLNPAIPGKAELCANHND